MEAENDQRPGEKRPTAKKGGRRKKNQQKGIGSKVGIRSCDRAKKVRLFHGR